MKLKILINYNNETGNELYSVSLISDITDWIDSFPSLEEAIMFCDSNNYTIEKFRKTF